MIKKIPIYLKILILLFLILITIFYINKKEQTIPKEENTKEVLNLKKESKDPINTSIDDRDSKETQKTNLTQNINPKRTSFLKHNEGLKTKLLKKPFPKSNLYKALFNNNYEYFKKLDNEGVDLKEDLHTDFFMLMVAFFIEDKRILNILNKQDFPFYEKDTLSGALEARNFIYLEYLIKQKDYDINNKTESLSFKLLAFGKKDLEQWVEAYGGEYNLYDQKNFYYKIRNFSKENINKYINEGFIFTKENIPELISRASRIGITPEELEYLNYLSNDDKNYVNAHKNNALLSAIESKKTNLSSIKWFIENDYDLKQKNKFGENALEIAFRNKKEDVIVYLLNNDFNPSEKLKVRKNYSSEYQNYKNLYQAAKKENLPKVQKYLEENYNYEELNN